MKLGRVLRWLAFATLVILVSVGAANIWVVSRARSRIFTDAGQVLPNEVGLVLGTARSVHGKYVNPFFAGRIAAAAELYHKGKVHHLLVTGDNHIAGYDEPSDMRDALVAQGVPESIITLDYAGFRTLDSLVRAREVFGLNSLTIITDDFHAARSVVLGLHFDIDAICYCPPPVPMKWSLRVRIRELLARFRTCIDLYILHTRPHFLGQRETIR